MALARLREEAELAHRNQGSFVFGEGSPYARLVIVGEAPGEEEAETGRPFVGRAGKLLDGLLAQVTIARSEVWITNVVKHRPTRAVDDRLVNRPPTAAEVRADLAWLQRELEILQPRVILCLGNLAASTLIHKNFKMTEERGRWFEGPYGSRILASYHPAFVLRRRGPEQERLLEEVRRDLHEVKRAIME